METIRILIASVMVLCATAFATTGPAHGFNLPTTKGNVSLDSLRGHVVYLDFWASWCDPCKKSFPWMDKIQQKYADKGLRIVAVNLDRKQENVEKFLTTHPASFTVVFDPAATLPPLYDVKVMPSSFLIDKDGNIVSTHTGFQEKDAEKLEKQLMEMLGK